MKEIKIRVNTDSGDFKRKVDQGNKFLEEGEQVMVSLQMRGRENAHPQKAVDMVSVFICCLSGRIQRKARLDGKRVTALVVPDGKRK